MSYEKFSDQLRKVMQLSNREAQRLNHEYIGTEHLLLGLLLEPNGMAGAVLRSIDVTSADIRRRVMQRVQEGPKMITLGKLPQTPRARQVIELAIKAASDCHHIGTEHLLIGLAIAEGVAGQVLAECKITIERIHAEIAKVSARTEPAMTPIPTPTEAALHARIAELEGERDGQIFARKHIEQQRDEARRQLAECREECEAWKTQREEYYGKGEAPLTDAAYLALAVLKIIDGETT